MGTNKTYVSQLKYDSISNHTVFSGDIIFSTFISTETKVAIVPNYIKYAINKADCLCVRPFKLVNNKYVEYFLSTRFTYSLLANQVHGATRPRINTTQLKSVPLPLCSEIEQNQIVQEIETRLSVCDKVEQTITQSLEKAKALRQSILKKAFEGRLLNDDELAACKKAKDYEPAGELLKKIQAEKAKKEGREKLKKKKKTTGKKAEKK
ncbi:MAG: restriction endonuclease subunit S [Desulfobacter sp.]